jgi:hypothetical protein
MPLYQVRPGYTHGAQRQYGPGAVVELTEAAAAGFADKLLRLPEAEAEVEAEVEAKPAVISAAPRKGKARPVP